MWGDVSHFSSGYPNGLTVWLYDAISKTSYGPQSNYYTMHKYYMPCIHFFQNMSSHGNELSASTTKDNHFCVHSLSPGKQMGLINQSCCLFHMEPIQFNSAVHNGAREWIGLNNIFGLNNGLGSFPGILTNAHILGKINSIGCKTMLTK